MRRRNDPDRIEVVTNPNDPPFGEFAFTVYDDYHPVGGPRKKWMRQKLRGWAGSTITFGVMGYRKSWRGGSGHARNHWRAWKHLRLERYNDLFGSEGVLLQIIKKQLSADSGHELVITQFTISRGG